jgi:tetratricopeptide (TPR) repeat protein
MSLNKVIALCLVLAAALPALAVDPPAPPAAPPPAWVAGYRVRFPLRPVVDFATEKQPTASVIARLPAAGYLRADGSDICVQTQAGELLPVSVLSHNPAGDTLIQFKRNGNDPAYWAYAGNPTAPAANAPPIPEGISVEFRDWEGDSLASWPEVVAGLKKSKHVTSNSFVGMVAQNVNPGRPDSHRMFTASYRGYLKVPEDDTHKFYVGVEDAVFLFIDGERVFEQKGSNRFAVRFPSNAWVEVPLTAGVHPFEIHHVCGANALASQCSFYFKNDGVKKKLSANFVPPEMFAQATLAEVTGIEGPNGAPTATFTWGVDDTLSTPGITFHLGRFEAQGAVKNPAAIEWDFGDGTRAKGRSAMHVYLKSGPYYVTMKVGDGVPPVTQRVYMWTAPSPTSPFSLAKAVELLTTSEWEKWDTQRVNSLFDFLTVSEQPNRWPLVEKIGRHLLKQPDLDLKRRVSLQTTIMEAMAEQGRGAEAMQLMQEALTAAGKLPSLKVMALLKGADIQWNYLKEYDQAAQLYEKIINGHRGLDIPAVREAAIHWGDLYTQAGDMTQAETRYRLAKTLGGERFAATAQTEAIQRGAQLRIAEQKLRSGDVRGTRLLLERMEIDFPEQKLEGTYRFLRAETDRFAGRYEEATRHYEVLLKLRQWAGFRDRAIHGLADCAFRQEDFATALGWFDKLRESFSEYFEAQKLDKIRDLVKARVEAAETAKKAGTAAVSESFRGYITGFEPDEKEPAGTLAKITLEPMLGIDGPQVGVIRNGSLFTFTKDLKNLHAGGNLWVEFWYREQMQQREVQSWSNVVVSITPASPSPPTADDAGKAPAKAPVKPVVPVAFDSVTIPLQRTYGQWRKVATRLRVPLVQDGTVKLTFVNAYGTLRMDGLKILPVSDRQGDSLRSFIEASEIE